MNLDTIIKLAKEAGLWLDAEGMIAGGELNSIPRFVALIEDHLNIIGIHSCHPSCQRPGCVMVREAVAREREECAKVCDLEYAACWNASAMSQAKQAQKCAAAIRSRN